MIITDVKLDVRTDTVDGWFHIAPFSDLHLGTRNCDEKAIIRDLKEALEKKARIHLNGDVFDAILTKDQRRFTMSVLKPGMAERDDILNQIVLFAIDFLEPYAENIDVFGLGNHELALIKYHNVDITRLTIDGLNEKLRQKGSAHRIAHGGYTGYVRYRCNTCSTGKPHTETYKVLYHHGSGSESPVTKGMIDIARKRVNWVYDLYLFGHKHNLFAAKDMLISCPSKGDRVEYKTTLSVQTGGFLRNYMLQTQDNAGIVPYSEMGGLQPKPIGCPFVQFKWGGRHNIMTQRAIL